MLKGKAQIKLRKPSSPVDGQSAGFSIIEIMVVLVILGILSVVIVPRLYDSYVSTSETSALNQVVRDIRYAGEYALAKRDTVWVEFDVPGNSYAIYGGDTVAEKTLLENTRGEGNFVIQLGAGEYQRLTLTSANFDGSPNLEFDKFGIPILSNNGVVVLNSTYTITVESETGTVTWQ